MVTSSIQDNTNQHGETLTNSSLRQGCQKDVLIYTSVLCCFIFHRTANLHSLHLPRKLASVDWKGFRPSLQGNTVVKKVIRPTLRTVPFSVNYQQTATATLTVTVCHVSDFPSAAQGKTPGCEFTQLSCWSAVKTMSPVSGNHQQKALMKVTPTGKVKYFLRFPQAVAVNKTQTIEASPSYRFRDREVSHSGFEAKSPSSCYST